jgi:hypothetical protein
MYCNSSNRSGILLELMIVDLERMVVGWMDDWRCDSSEVVLASSSSSSSDCVGGEGVGRDGGGGAVVESVTLCM